MNPRMEKLVECILLQSWKNGKEYIKLPVNLINSCLL